MELGWADSEDPHAFNYEASWRTVLPEKASFAAAPNEALHSFKSSIKHTFTADNRDDPRIPTEGLFFRSTSELAGLGGDVKFIKSHLEMQAHLPTNMGATISTTASFGLLQGLAGDRSRISDRFFVGGPLLMRGFRTKGLGPRSGRNPAGAKGGDVFFTACTAVTADLPSQPLRAFAIKMHAFVNAGNCVGAGDSGSAISKVPQLFAKYRSVMGIGVVLPLQIGRVELNYCWPLRTFRFVTLKELVACYGLSGPWFSKGIFCS